MKRELEEIAKTSEPLVQAAVEAMKQYREAQAAGAPEAEVERLRVLANSAFQAVTDYQLGTIGHQPLTRH